MRLSELSFRGFTPTRPKRGGWLLFFAHPRGKSIAPNHGECTRLSSEREHYTKNPPERSGEILANVNRGEMAG